MIEVQGLSKEYDTVVALRGITFSIERGEVVGFLGPNGAGKSTAMKIITCYQPQTGGTVKVAGFNINDQPLEVRRRIGYLPESNPLYHDMVVYDYLRYVGSMRGVERARIDERIVEVVKMCGIEDRLAQRIGTLSKGYKQRVGLAQALIHDPDILILDEPTSGLDPNQIVEIRNLIKSLGEKRTVILSTHNLPEVMATCNRMLIIHNGSLVADGTPAELQAKEEQNLRIQVIGRGVSEEELAETLAALPDVSSATNFPTPAEGDAGVEVVAPQGVDLQTTVFRLFVDKGWELVELHRQVLDLEGIFRKLTKEI